MSNQVETRLAHIESDVEHIKKDTTDLHVELRRTNDKIDVTNKHIEEVKDTLTTKIDGLNEKLHSLTVRGLLLYFGLWGGILTIIAKVFKWI